MKKLFRTTLSVFAVSAVAATTLSACSPAGTQSESQVTPTATKTAGMFTKDLATCITNDSGSPIIIEWAHGLSTHEGSGLLDQAGTYCGEGPGPIVKITYEDGFSTYLNAVNPAIGEAYIVFTSTDDPTLTFCDKTSVCVSAIRGQIYTSAEYSQGQTINSAVNNYPMEVTRLSDSDWINFDIVVE